MSTRPALTLEPGAGPGTIPQPADLEVLLWHWGKVGAGAKFTHELIRALMRVDGVRARLCAAEGSDLGLVKETDPSIDTTLVRTFRGRRDTPAGRLSAALGLLGLPRLASTFRKALESRPDTVALCTFQSIWDAAVIPILRRRKGRFVLVMHDAMLHPGDSYPFRASVMEAQVRAADALIVLSDHVGRMARDVHGFPADRIWTVPHGAFSFGAEPAEGRKFPAGRPARLLFLGRIVAYKGLPVLVEAYRTLRERGLAVELDVVGQGDMGESAAALAALPGVSVANRWASDAEIGGALSRADVVALSYVEASQSGVAAAAMTAGLPIVATPVGGLVEQVDHGRTGLVAEGITPEAFADAVETLLRNPALYERCSDGALRRAREELGWDPIARTVAGVLREVAARPRRGA